MTDKTSEPQILGYKPKASEETTEEDNLRDLLNQGTVQKTPEPLEKIVKKTRRVSFGQVVGIGQVDSTPDKDGEDDKSDPETNPCHYDRNLQIFSFVSLFLLVAIAIAILANSGQSKEIPSLFIKGFQEKDFTDKTPKEEFKNFEINCTFSGYPEPEVEWFLDGYHLPKDLDFEKKDLNLGKFNTEDNCTVYKVTSKLTIKEVHEKYGGSYACTAGKLPEQQHSARINVYGPPIAREQTKVKIAVGNSLSLNCPMGGYPIGKVDWKKDGTNLLSNSKKITFQSIESENSGKYTCTASNGLGKSATAVIDLEVTVDINQAGTFPSDRLNDGSYVLVAGASLTNAGHAKIVYTHNCELFQNMAGRFKGHVKKHKSLQCKKVFRTRGPFRPNWCKGKEKEWNGGWRYVKYQNRRNPIKETYSLTVQGTCCWEIFAEPTKGGGTQILRPGQINKAPENGYIRRLKAIKPEDCP